MTPAELKKTIEGSNHAQRFLAVVESETGYCDMQCHGCKTNLSPANMFETARAHVQNCKAPVQSLELLLGRNRNL